MMLIRVAMTRVFDVNVIAVHLSGFIQVAVSVAVDVAVWITMRIAIISIIAITRVVRARHS